MSESAALERQNRSSVSASAKPLPDDEDLVRSSIHGSREAFGTLVERHARGVRAVCLARLGWHQELDDLVQEVFIRAFQGLRRLAEPGAFGGYLHRIAHNLCIDKIRRRKRDVVSLETVELDPPAPAVVDEDDRFGTLRRLVGRLPEALREALLLFYFEEQSVSEIARCLGVTEAAINQRLHRGRTQLREGFDLGKEVRL